jgi:hypothetical protein
MRGQPPLARLTFDRFATALLFLGIACAACLMPVQNDTWWHLRAGRDMWAERSVLLRDEFSFTAAGTYWPNHEWLSQIIFYAVYRLGGLPLLTACAAALVTGAWAICWTSIKARPIVRVILVAAALIPSSIVWAVRPQVLTLFLVSLTVWIMTRRRYLLLPPVFLFWANAHGAVLLGFVLLGAALAASVLYERRHLRVLSASAIGCVIATFVTPLGWSFWPDILHSLERIRAYGIAEWQPTALCVPAHIPFWILAAVLAGLIVVRRRAAAERLPFVAISALVLLPLALRSNRNIAPFLLVAVPAIGTLIDAHSAEAAPAGRRHERPVLNAWVLAVAACAALFAVAFAWRSRWDRLGWDPLPPALIAAIGQCPERMYNKYRDGGYLVWFVPTRKVFIDSRQDPYPPALIGQHARVELTGDYADLFQEHGIECALVSPQSSLSDRLLGDGWRTLYADEAWLLARRRP